jgi:hypothetical protein
MSLAHMLKLYGSFGWRQGRQGRGMEDDLAHAYQEKLRRDALASVFAQEIQQPHKNPRRSLIASEDLEALAMAIERSSPDQVAQWIQTLLYYAIDGNDWDDDAWQDDAWDERL